MPTVGQALQITRRRAPVPVQLREGPVTAVAGGRATVTLQGGATRARIVGTAPAVGATVLVMSQGSAAYCLGTLS